MTPQQIANLLQQVNEAYNELILNAKSIEQFDEQLTLLVDSYMLVSNAGVTKKMKLQQIISAISQTYIDRLIYVGAITIDGNDVTVPEGAQALISNITYFTTIDYTFTVPFSDTGKTRTDIIIMNTSAVLTRIAGVETVGIAVRPNIPPNTVLVTQINVTEDSLTSVPGLLFLGEFDSIEYLEASHPTALTGSYAIVTNLTDSAIYFYSEFNGWFGVGGGGGSTPNLQDVTDEGYETTNIMTFNFPSGVVLELGDGFVRLTGTDGEKVGFSVEGLAQMEVYDNNTDQSVNLSPALGVGLNTAGNYVSRIKNNNATTDNQEYNLPDKTDGLPHTLATFDEIPTDLSQLGEDSTHRVVTDAEKASWNAVIGGSVFQTVWNATTNSPTLASGTGTNGHYYIVSTAGSTNLDGITSWNVGDWAIFDGTVWRKVDNTDAVSSVNGITGAVLLDTSNVPDTLNKRYVTDANLTTIGATSGTNTGDNATNAQYSGLDALKMNKPSMMKLVSAYGLANSTSLQKLFNVGSSGIGSFTAAANKTYKFECEFDITGLSSTSGTISFGILGTAGISTISYKAIAAKGNLVSVFTANIVSAQVATAIVITTAGNPTTAKAVITGIIITSTAGSIQPAMAMSVGIGTAQVEPNSFFRIQEVGADTFTATSDIV